MWGAYPYRDEVVRRSGLMRGSREICIAFCDAKYHWWRDLRDRYVRRHKLTLTVGQVQTLEQRIAEKAWCHGYGVHDNFFTVPPGQVWGLDQLRYIRGEWLNEWNLGDYKHPDGDYCDMEPNTHCQFCRELFHPGKSDSIWRTLYRGQRVLRNPFCSDRCKRASGLLHHGFPKYRSGTGDDVFVPLLILINSLAKGIQKQNPIAMKILSRRTKREQSGCM